MLPFVVSQYVLTLYYYTAILSVESYQKIYVKLISAYSTNKHGKVPSYYTLLTVDERVCVFVTQVPKKCDIFVCQFMHCQKEEKVEEKRDSKNNVVTKAQPSVMHSMCNSASTFPRLAIRCNTELVMDILSKKVSNYISILFSFR